MKKALTLLLVLCMIFTLAACGEKEPAETKPVETQPTEPAAKEYVLLRTKADIMQGLQMTPDNIAAWFEAYTTTNADEAANAIRWDSRKTIEYLWSKEAIPGGVIVNASMFTTTVPGDVTVNLEADLTYDAHYIGVIDKNGLTINVAGVDLLAKLPAGTTGRSISVSEIGIRVLDRAETNPDAEYTSKLTGNYNLKQNQGLLTFKSDSEELDLGILGSMMGSTELLVPALSYAEYMQNNFVDPIVQISCTITIDGKAHEVMLGGTFTMSIDPASGLTADQLMGVANNFMNQDFSDMEGLGGLGDLFGGLFNTGTGLEDLLGGNGGN